MTWEVEHAVQFAVCMHVPGRLDRLVKVSPINLIHLGEVAHVLQKDGHLHHVIE